MRPTPRATLVVGLALLFGRSAGCTPSPDPPSPASLFVLAPGSPIQVSARPGHVALDDVNRDGKLDVLVIHARGVSVLLGRGDGKFQSPGERINVPEPPSEMALGEINGDRALDLILAHHASYNVMLFYGDGNGSFVTAPHSPFAMKVGEHPHTHGLDRADLNSDGALDLVLVNSDDNDVSVAFGDGKGGFTRAPASFPGGRSPYPCAIGDLDGDANADIVVTNLGRETGEPGVAGAITLLFGDGAGAFVASTISVKTASPGYVIVTDVNEDGRSDLVASHLERREFTILLGEGGRNFREADGSPFDLGHPAWGISAADVDADGHTDVVAAAGDGVCVLLGDGRSGFRAAAASPFATGGRGAWRLAVGDVNRDGQPDVVTCNLETNDVSVLLGRYVGDARS